MFFTRPRVKGKTIILVTKQEMRLAKRDDVRLARIEKRLAREEGKEWKDPRKGIVYWGSVYSYFENRKEE